MNNLTIKGLTSIALSRFWTLGFVIQIGHLSLRVCILISETDNFPLHFTEKDIANNKARVKESLARISITIEISFFAVCLFLNGR